MERCVKFFGFQASCRIFQSQWAIRKLSCRRAQIVEKIRSSEDKKIISKNKTNYDE